jgi:sugar phosphate permease
LKLAAIWLPKNRFGMVCGLATALGMIGAMIGDISMASLVNHHGWRHTVMYSAIVGLILALIIFVVMKDNYRHSDSHERTTFKHLMPDIIQLIRNPQIWINGIVGCLLYLPTSAFAELWGVPYLQSAFDFSRQNAAGAISMIFLGWAIGGPIAGFISDQVRLRRWPIILGSIVAAALILILLYAPAMPKIGIYIILFIFGAFSSAQVLIFAVAREISPTKLSGTSVAMTNMLVMLGGVVFQPVVGMLLDTRWNGLKVNGVPIYTVSDYKFALMILPIGLALSAILMLFMRETFAGFPGVKNNAQLNGA